MLIRRARVSLTAAGAGLVLATSIMISGLVTQLTVAVADSGDDPAAKARSKQAGSTPKPRTASDPKAPKLPEPPATWREHCFEHRELLKLVASNDDVAIYFDDAMPRRGIAGMVSFVTKAWQYTKKTYGTFGPDPRLYAIFHQGKFGGGHPSTYFDESHDHRSATDCGHDTWDHNSIDIVSHEIGHIVEGSNNNVEESPAFEMWRDSKWIEFYQYDLYLALGLKADARRIYEKWYNQTDDFPRPRTHWFRDFFYPLWRDHGHAQVMVNFFELVAKHFPRRPYGNDRHPRYTRRMTWGEFIHFMSGAAHKDIRPLARKAFGWPPEWNDLYKKARQDFPDIKYPA